jgi:hypothetical protein
LLTGVLEPLHTDTVVPSSGNYPRFSHHKIVCVSSVGEAILSFSKADIGASGVLGKTHKTSLLLVAPLLMQGMATVGHLVQYVKPSNKKFHLGRYFDQGGCIALISC